MLHFAEFGVVLLLFLIGLELRPKRLWAMRAAIFGLGGAQVALTGAGAGHHGHGVRTGLAGRACSPAWRCRCPRPPSRCRFWRRKASWRCATVGWPSPCCCSRTWRPFPLIALPPLFAVSVEGRGASRWNSCRRAKAIGVIVVVVVVGRYVLDGIFRLVARTRVKEAMTASALLTVVGVTLVMEQAGLSASLGAFIAGVLLADSDYRHEIEADIAPFEGLLLGLFFTAIGMSLNLGLIGREPHLVRRHRGRGLLAVKSGILYVLGRRAGLEAGPSRRFALAIAQGGEFAFVLFTAGIVLRRAGASPSPTCCRSPSRCRWRRRRCCC